MIDLRKKNYFLFDMDGTLVDLERLNYHCFNEVTQEITGTELSFVEYMNYVAGAGTVTGLLSYFASKGVKAPSSEEFLKKYRVRKEFFLDHHFDEMVTVIAGAKEFLTKAKQVGKKLAVGTSTNKFFALMILNKTGLLPYFDTVVTADDVHHRKPNPEIYEKALFQLKGTKPETLIFENTYNGVKSAENAGIDYLVIHSTGENDDVVAKNRNSVDSYGELLPQLY
ncbi:hypothetical protein CO112_00645 [Candidatus Dojkabacteria bacterium CG_4_9_14_3_um_filter_150_Dojkabacteria_WS6_41_13]|uniref:HAD family phosphatase n=1 Tax=Candidatus Dojkabacteria bacterium CG_4_10_14_0_2_um_filter_Dojkabacteria_WS6_41_15 TaxID=2014249 RepID=A0A2M7W327_9BACT|nr:MAG: hypothetical protein COZ14_03775 [Candidatus Dojkabacteria bacterium CG_4_10_14_3_um_filter_Dojkabacteria_WS6_41_9]PJA15698.1 MAG: hypothetical protein COX64_00400 [Candidatus Dojkabacteria bacterium CG_4_10_14_0_2_um_filter_Dojkabacteria_WS6_41_15]PJB23568.1 MAG: hypothetical protein CO112_00645 [Candidatus Dojkabacteria bacterium CG_4_9_14_3_um_filter_150_Dojkabacteria_WS6_41_13]